MTETVTISVEEAETLALDILRATGLSDAQCAAVADVILRAERDECHSHGLWRLIGVAHSVKIGRINKHAAPKVTDHAPAIVKVDADHGFSSHAYKAGIGLAIAKARTQGLAALAITNCHHFSALWPEIEPLAEQGLAAIAMTPSHAWVAPAGGTKPVFGTNPFAFAWPRPGHKPFVFDFATSATARGEIELHRRAGLRIHEGLAVDREGEPTTDPAAALKGAMLTFGAHKGSALAAMVDLLAGPMIGDLLSLESKAADGGANATPLHGELIILFDPAMFLGEATAANLARAEILFSAILGQGARLPSDRRYAAREKTARFGMTLPVALHAELTTLAAATGTTPLRHIA